MNYCRMILAAALTGIILSGGFSSSAAELSIEDIEIISADELSESPSSGQAGTVSGQTQDMPTQTEITSPQTENITAQIENSPVQTERLPAQVERTPALSENASGQAKDLSAQTENSSGQTGNTSAQTEDLSGQAGNAPIQEVIQTNNPSSGVTSTDQLLPAEDGSRSTVSQGLYEIASAMDPDFVLDIRHCTVSDSDSRTVQLYRSLNVNQQKYYVETLPDRSYRISVLHTGDVLTALPDASVSMTAMEHPKDRAASESQSWILEPAQSASFFIRTPSGLYLSLGSSRACAGAHVALSSFTGEPSQMWQFCSTWVSSEACADTDLINPYSEDGPCGNLELVLQFYAGSETLTAKDLAAHMEETGEHRFMLDPDYLDSYVSQLAQKYDTEGKPELFHTSSGDEITLYTGDYVWKLDQEGTKDLLQTYLETDGTQTLPPVWTQRGQSIETDIRESYPETYGADNKESSGNATDGSDDSADSENAEADSNGIKSNENTGDEPIADSSDVSNAEGGTAAGSGNSSSDDRINLSALGDQGIGDSYLEVDLTRQKVFLYKDGEKLLETDCVSGAVDHPKSCTPVGVYRIYYMNSPDTLDGADYSEFVNYWMAFYGNYGLHDATWRDEFGGDIYLTDGSHGCLNLPLEAAEQIYNTVGLGFPVILYK